MNNLTKWREDQDAALREAINKHGTCWELVLKQINTNRSLFSIIKRWHAKLKHQKDPQSIISPLNFIDANPTFVPKIKSKLGQQQNNDPIDIAWKKNWDLKDDLRLKELVIEKNMTDWQILSTEMKVEPSEVKQRWMKVIYPQIRNSDRIANSLKWTPLEDRILINSFKKSLDWSIDVKILLPMRTLGSTQARYRRIHRFYEEVKSNKIQNKFLARRECLKRIARKRKEMQRELEGKQIDGHSNGQIKEQINNNKMKQQDLQEMNEPLQE